MAKDLRTIDYREVLLNKIINHETISFNDLLFAREGWSNSFLDNLSKEDITHFINQLDKLQYRAEDQRYYAITRGENVVILPFLNYARDLYNKRFERKYRWY